MSRWEMPTYLMHSAKGTSWEKKDHKYTKKIQGKDGKWYYVYGEVEEVDESKRLKSVSEEADEQTLRDYDFFYPERTYKEAINNNIKANKEHSLNRGSKLHRVKKKVDNEFTFGSEDKYAKEYARKASYAAQKRRKYIETHS